MLEAQNQVRKLELLGFFSFEATVQGHRHDNGRRHSRTAVFRKIRN